MSVIEIIFLVVVSGMGCALVLLGVGFLLQACLDLESSPLAAFGIGLGVSIAVLEFYHLVRPVDYSIGIAVILCGLLGLAVRFAQLRQFLTDLATKNTE